MLQDLLSKVSCTVGDTLSQANEFKIPVPILQLRRLQYVARNYSSVYWVYLHFQCELLPPSEDVFFDLHHSLQQHQILNLLSEARDWTHILTDTVSGS